MVMNATVDGVSALATVSPIGIFWLVFIIAFVGITFTLFVLYKNFRRCLYGLSVMIPLSIIGWISKGTGKSASTGNFIPMIVIGGIIVTIVISILIGMLIEKTRWAKKIEKSIK